MYQAVEIGDTVKVWKIKCTNEHNISSLRGSFDSEAEANEAIAQMLAARHAYAYDPANY